MIGYGELTRAMEVAINSTHTEVVQRFAVVPTEGSEFVRDTLGQVATVEGFGAALDVATLQALERIALTYTLAGIVAASQRLN